MSSNPPIPNPMTYLLRQFQNLNMYVSSALNSLPSEIKRILNRTLTSGDYSLGNTDIVFFSNATSGLVSQSKTLSKVKPVTSTTYSVVIPGNDSNRHLIERFTSDFNLDAIKIVAGEWQFFLPAKVVGGGSIKLIADITVRDSDSNETLLFSAQSLNTISNSNYAIVKGFIKVEGQFTINPLDILIIEIYAIGLNVVENTVLLQHSDNLSMYFAYPKESIDIDYLTSRLAGIDVSIGNTNTNVSNVVSDISSINTDISTITSDLSSIDTNISTLTGIVNGLKGGLKFKDYWNASTNTPTLPTPSESNAGWYWIVSVDGNTDIDGETDWKYRDWIVSNGVSYVKQDYTPDGGTVPSATTSAEGISRRATNVEISAGADDAAHVTPYGFRNFLNNLNPTTVIKALVRRSTTEELQAGTEDTSYVSPAGLTTWIAHLLTNNAFGNVYATVNNGLPTGGTLGQFLTKTDIGSIWSTIKTLGNSSILGIGDVFNDASVHTTVADTDKILFLSIDGDLFTAEVSKLKELIFAGGTMTGTFNFNNNIINNAIFRNCSASQSNVGTTSSTPTTINLDVTVAHTFLVTCGGAHTLYFDFMGWDTTDINYIELILTNMGLGTFVCTDTIQWKNPDDTYTTNFATYMTARGGQSTLKTSGVDTFIFEYVNGTLYGTLI